MNKISLVILLLFVLFLFSCKKGNEFPRVQTITKGYKWNLQIGSSPEDIYSQLQLLGKEKQFNSIAIVYRKPYSKPEDIKNLISFYNAITLESTEGVDDRALIQFFQDKVSSIESGTGILDSVSKWPQDISDDAAIQVNDQMDAVYEKLLGIYKFSAYSSYHIILPDKPLDKPYDNDMSNYKEWAFEFTQKINASLRGDNSVHLYFKNSQLVKIENVYNEYEVVIN